MGRTKLITFSFGVISAHSRSRYFHKARRQWTVISEFYNVFSFLLNGGGRLHISRISFVLEWYEYKSRTINFFTLAIAKN